MTATELADIVHERSSLYATEARQVERELRRIPELERRALTDEEICVITKLHSFLPETLYELSPLVKRLAPPPQVEWTEAVPGVHVAELDGFSLVVYPSGKGEAEWCACRPGGGVDGSDCADDIDSAKAAAVEWVRKNGGR